MNLEQLLATSKKERWPYPKTFEAMKALGMESYDVYFAQDYKTEYKGTFGEWTEGAPEGYHPIAVSSIFSAAGVKAAIMRHAEKKTDYIGFLEEIGQAGASHYRVDMATRAVTYYNPAETGSHVELVPLWKS